ncbi:MAG: thioesterase family protein [Stellaceae bacterium]
MTPLPAFELAVPPAWIDYNGHLNMAYYLVAFDKAADVLFDALGVGEAYRRQTDHSMFALESHVTYGRETKAGDLLRVECQLLDADAKRLHFFQRMTLAESGDQVATLEIVVLHVRMAGPKSAPFPATIKARIDTMLTEHRTLPPPPELGRKVGLRGTA